MFNCVISLNFLITVLIDSALLVAVAEDKSTDFSANWAKDPINSPSFRSAQNVTKVRFYALRFNQYILVANILQNFHCLFAIMGQQRIVLLPSARYMQKFPLLFSNQRLRNWSIKSCARKGCQNVLNAALNMIILWKPSCQNNRHVFSEEVTSRRHSSASARTRFDTSLTVRAEVLNKRKAHYFCCKTFANVGNLFPVYICGWSVWNISKRD